MEVALAVLVMAQVATWRGWSWWLRLLLHAGWIALVYLRASDAAALIDAGAGRPLAAQQGRLGPGNEEPTGSRILTSKNVTPLLCQSALATAME